MALARARQVAEARRLADMERATSLGQAWAGVSGKETRAYQPYFDWRAANEERRNYVQKQVRKAELEEQGEAFSVSNANLLSKLHQTYQDIVDPSSTLAKSRQAQAMIGTKAYDGKKSGGYWSADRTGQITDDYVFGFDKYGNEVTMGRLRGLGDFWEGTPREELNGLKLGWKHLLAGYRWDELDEILASSAIQTADPDDPEGTLQPGQWDEYTRTGALSLLGLASPDKKFFNSSGYSLRDALLSEFNAETIPDEEWARENAGGRGGGGGGRGGGGGGVKYVAPDKAAVEEAVANYVVAVTGMKHSHIIAAGVKKYMEEARRGFKLRESQDVDPMQAVKALVRGTAEYKHVNKNRPDSVDELDWVSSAQGKLRSLGLAADAAQALGIEQASIGAADNDLIDAAGIRAFADTGRLLDVQRQELKNVVRGVARLAN